MDLSLRQIRAFVSVAHLKSFTRAAALLHLSQPALTVQIRRLEEALGVKLLDRNSRTVELTRVGRELAPVLQRLLRELDSVVIDTRGQAARRCADRGLAVRRRRPSPRRDCSLPRGQPAGYFRAEGRDYEARAQSGTLGRG